MNIDPVAFSLFGLEVRWYGILIAIGAFLAVYTTDKLAEKKNYKNGLYQGVGTDLSLIVIILGIIGARLYYVAFQWDYYSHHLSEIPAIRNGGLAIYGGILAGILAGYFFCRIKKLKFLTVADCVAPGLALAQGIGRWGNFINGEAHGGPTNLPWAIVVDGQKVHPTFLYESLIDIGIFLFLYFYLSKRQKFEGQLFFLYFIIYGMGRFFVEGMRTDSLYLGSYRVSQLVSLILVGMGSFFYFYFSKKEKN
ncbi:MAG: prolipoprotein diacylglyceryl transferase [Tissierellia bacterium]|nr:prolipoprotein diacylglyceryl transferase [Tissierellia bacterium]